MSSSTVAKEGKTSSLYRVLESNNRPTLLKLVKVARLAILEEDTSDQHFTMFAPSDESLRGLESLDVGSLRHLLGEHLVPDTKMGFDDFEDGMELTNLNGNSLIISKTVNQELMVGGAAVVKSPDHKVGGPDGSVVHLVQGSIFPFLSPTAQ